MAVGSNDDVAVIVELDPIRPQRIATGPGEASMMSTAVFRLCGQVPTGPSGVAAQSCWRMRSPISPPPAGQTVWEWGIVLFIAVLA
jgi:hypothetical protein